MKLLKYIFVTQYILFSFSCSDYLDVVPDNVATIEYAFRMRATAERYLYTCYSYLPNDGSQHYNVGRMGADEFWLANVYSSRNSWVIARGGQNANSPILSPWSGTKSCWEGISQCNVFLENIDKVPDMTSTEIRQWKAEAKFLKAYYHFILFKHFGPIPINDRDLPIDAPTEDVRVFRRPVDEVIKYIADLMFEAAEDGLEDKVLDENSELGRVTRPVALGMRAKVLVYGASSLFNGSKAYAGLKNADGTILVNQTYDRQKWVDAAAACKQAIDVAHEIGYKLFEFEPNLQSKGIPEEIRIQMNCRGTLTEKWNTEIIWANTNSRTDELQKWIAPRALNASQRTYTGANGSLGASLNAAYLFYTKNGVPLDEDLTRDYSQRLNLRTATATDEKYTVKVGYTTVDFNFDREPRFYGALGFDGGIWYGNGKYDASDLYWLEMKMGQFLGKEQEGWHPVCGYFVKKYVNYTNTATSPTVYSVQDWPWVILRLADLYLLYSEALNEMNESNDVSVRDEALFYVNEVRKKGGLKSIEESWTTYSRNPDKWKTRDGLAEIIERERAIEFLFEGERFWDLRRWQSAPFVLNQSIIGWDVDQDLQENYYRERVLFTQKFSFKDYLWPIKQSDLQVNSNLVQNPGW